MSRTRAALHSVLTDLAEAGVDQARQEAAELGWSPSLWQDLEEKGFTLIDVPVESGGSGGDLRDLATAATVVGRYALPVPLVETALAARVLALTGRAVPAGPLALVASTSSCGQPVTGELIGVAFARAATHLVVVQAGEDGVAGVGVLPLESDNVRLEHNLAGEPRDTVVLRHLLLLTPAPPGLARDLADRTMLLRALLMMGALRRVLQLTVQYAGERVQFGRPLHAFQAVQQQLAELAGAVEQAGALCDAAVRAVASEPPPTDLTTEVVLAAKTVTGQAARAAVEIGHQVHGTMGWTADHSLHHYTERLMAWRDEDGEESVLARRLGRLILARGPEAFWDSFTAERTDGSLWT